MKCPICGNDLEHYHTGFVCQRHCLNGKNVWGGEETLKDLDRTRKALDVAVDALKECANRDNWSIGFTPWSEDGTEDALYTEYGYKTAEQALERITALEQKEVK